MSENSKTNASQPDITFKSIIEILIALTKDETISWLNINHLFNQKPEDCKTLNAYIQKMLVEGYVFNVEQSFFSVITENTTYLCLTFKHIEKKTNKNKIAILKKIDENNIRLAVIPDEVKEYVSRLFYLIRISLTDSNEKESSIFDMSIEELKAIYDSLTDD